MARQTKADRILNDAAMRLEAARIRERNAQSDLNTAKATLAVLQEAYDSLARELAPKPRKKAATASPAQAKLLTDKKEKEAAKVEGGNGADLEPENVGPLCGICGHGEQYQDHFQPSPNYHPFDAPAQSVDKKSKKKAAAANITQNSEIEKGAAISAGAD